MLPNNFYINKLNLQDKLSELMQAEKARCDKHVQANNGNTAEIEKREKSCLIYCLAIMEVSRIISNMEDIEI